MPAKWCFLIRCNAVCPQITPARLVNPNVSRLKSERIGEKIEILDVRCPMMGNDSGEGGRGEEAEVCMGLVMEAW